MNSLLESITVWVGAHSELMWAVTITSALTFVGTLIVVPMLLAWIPSDYFVKPPRQARDGWISRHPALQLLIKILKNVLGVGFILAGIAMLVLPGQGLLTMFVGITLVDLPGKRQLEVSLLRRPQVFRAVNWLRDRSKRPPLQLPSRDEDRSHG